MDMQLFWDSVITVVSVVGYMGYLVVFGLIVKSKK